MLEIRYCDKYTVNVYMMIHMYMMIIKMEFKYLITLVIFEEIHLIIAVI